MTINKLTVAEIITIINTDITYLGEVSYLSFADALAQKNPGVWIDCQSRAMPWHIAHNERAGGWLVQDLIEQKGGFFRLCPECQRLEYANRPCGCAEQEQDDWNAIVFQDQIVWDETNMEFFPWNRRMDDEYWKREDESSEEEEIVNGTLTYHEDNLHSKESMREPVYNYQDRNDGFLRSNFSRSKWNYSRNRKKGKVKRIKAPWKRAA